MYDNFSFIIDEVLPKQDFNNFKNFSQTTTYQTVENNGKKFYVAYPPAELSNLLQKKIEEVYNKKIKVILSFVRMATEFIDTDWNIHADLKVSTLEDPSHGAVFYLTENFNHLNGTALWSHKQYGHCAENFSTEKIKQFSKDSSNDIDEWEINSIIGGIENRLISYPAKYFHSKYPKEMWGATQKDCRLVVAFFYKIL